MLPIIFLAFQLPWNSTKNPRLKLDPVKEIGEYVNLDFKNIERIFTNYGFSP